MLRLKQFDDDALVNSSIRLVHPAPEPMTYAELDALEEAKVAKSARIFATTNDSSGGAR